MPIPILMPALSPTMEHGRLAKWLKKEGDAVAPGDVIAEIETDKASMEVEAVDEGKLGKILVPAGTDGVAVNAPIAVLLEEGEDSAALAGFDPGAISSLSSPEHGAPAAAAAAGAPRPEEGGQPLSGRGKTGAEPPDETGNGRIFASPLARRLAREHALDLALIEGSGPQGRIIRRDIDRALKEGLPQPRQAAVSAPSGEPLAQAMPSDQIMALYEKGSYEFVPHDNMRRTVAARLMQAKLTIPHFHLRVDCKMDALLQARQRLNERALKTGPGAGKLTLNDFLIKAAGLALRDVPGVNATWTGEGMLLHKSCDVAVAVAVEGGLFTPIIRQAASKSLPDISNEVKELTGRARQRRLAPHDYQGGATTISNLGMYGISSFDAVINPPHATILAAGASEKRAVAENGQIKIATMMTVTLTCDHRVADGALGAQFLTAFKSLIEEPVTLLG